MLHVTMSLVMGMLMKVAAAMLLIGCMDYGYQRWEFEKSIRMSKHEIKEEFKQTEGDPNLKAAIRQRMRQLSRQRMMHDVANATFVVTNPTHFAVALEYRRSMPAPKVLAKGMNLIARRIIEEAEKNGIPIIEDPPLARTIFRLVDVGGDIPPQIYRAVAELLAYVISLDRGIAAKVA